MSMYQNNLWLLIKLFITYGYGMVKQCSCLFRARVQACTCKDLVEEHTLGMSTPYAMEKMYVRINSK